GQRPGARAGRDPAEAADDAGRARHRRHRDPARGAERRGGGVSGGDRPADPVYEALAAFFAELAGAGVHDVVISPGSRSTPLALSAWWRDDLRCRVVLDE